MSLKVKTFNSELGLKINRFPDDTPLIHVENTDQIGSHDAVMIDWHYELDSEIFSLICVTKYLQERFPNNPIKLIMPYLPNARMDRVNKSDEVLTLKYFAEIINSLHFAGVYVLDAHSSVSLALINRIHQLDVGHYIRSAIKDFKPDILFMPDEGAHKRYSAMFNLPSTFGIKIRDWRSGEIKDYRLADPKMVKDKRVLIIDDICSRGGTFYHAGQLLNQIEEKNIGLYVSHCEKTIKDGDVLDSAKSHISQVYTADPLWHSDNDGKLSKIIKL